MVFSEGICRVACRTLSEPVFKRRGLRAPARRGRLLGTAITGSTQIDGKTCFSKRKLRCPHCQTQTFIFQNCPFSQPTRGSAIKGRCRISGAEQHAIHNQPYPRW